MMEEQNKKKHPGRPKKTISLKDLSNIARLHPTYAEIAAFFEVSEDTITRRMKEADFAEAYKRGLAHAKLSLRRAMMKSAIEDGSFVMQIWLSKNLLGFAEKQEIVSRTRLEEDQELEKLSTEELKRLCGLTEKEDGETESGNGRKRSIDR